ncbi:MAG: S8 family serine peptidase [Opitutaceae bacterium]|nr:S8 family serine peptidase [Opitutaceae bacterium]
MNKVLSRFLLVAATVFGLIARGANNPEAGEPQFSAREMAQGYRQHAILAKPRADRRATAEADETREGMRVVRKFERLGDLRVLELDQSDSAERAIVRLRASGRYDYVEPDYIRYATALPNDPDFAQLWGLQNTGQIRGTTGADISALAAWDIRRDASSVIVAVIDTGVNLAHTDIAANLWTNPSPMPGVNDLHGARFTNGNAQMTSGDPTDDAGHGTHVAGTIGAVGNNGTAIAGVAWNVKIMALKFITAAGSGSSADGIACIDYAIGHGAHIINASYGANGGSPLSQAEFDAINRARAAGIIFVAAAGNETANMDVSRHYPASLRLDNIVSVGASTRHDEVAVFSNYGAAVDLFAPGYDILSLDFDKPDGGTTLKSGTSMAAPHVSGALALLKAQFPGDNYRQLINRLLRGVDLGTKFGGQAQTNGRLNLFKALTTATNRPFNDDFADRPRLAGDNLAIRTNNTGATVEPGEPAHAGAAPAATLWWEWKATGSTPVTITTAGSAYDTVVAVYTGSAPSALSLVGSNDDDGGNVTSRVSFISQAGATYQIALDGKSGAAGSTFLTLNAAPSNDNFATPVVLTGTSARVTATNTLCSREPDEPRILNNPGGTSLWYSWTAPKSGRFQVAGFTVDFDPLLAIYTGTSLGSLTLVTAGDNTGFDGSQRPSVCTFDAIAGTTYRFTIDAKPAVGAGASNTGEFTLNLVDSLWQAATGRTGVNGDSVTGAPAVATDGTIYFGSIDKSVYALNPDGSLKWSFATTGGLNNSGGSIDTASPAVAGDGTIYIGNSVGRFFALTPAGSPRWIRDFGSSNSASLSPAIAADGTVYVKIGDGKLYALDPASGATKWSVDVRGPLTYASPVIAADGTIYQGSDDRSLYAVNPDGSLKWRFETDASGEVYSTPAIDSAGNLYFGVLNSGKFYSLDAAGRPRWIYTGSFESISSSAALSADGRTVYFGSYDRRLHALDTASGAARWTYQLANQVRASSPAVDASGVVYIGCYDFRLYAVAADGNLVRTYDTGGVVRSSPAIFGNTLYVGSNDRKVYAFELNAASAAGNWPQYRAHPRRLGRTLDDALVITVAPEGKVAAIGLPFTLSVVATGPNPLTYQWFKNGAAITGATSATYAVPAASTPQAGSYTVTVTSPPGSITSAPVTVRVEAPNPGRLVNLSVRTNAGTGTQTLIVGFSLVGSPDKVILVRGIGPSLTQFGVTGVLADPRLELFSGSTVLLANDNWGAQLGGGSPTAVANSFTATGAFALDPASVDAAVVRGMAAGNYTAQVTSASGTGIALAELYDTAPDGGARLVNVSARAQVGTGGNILIAGFTVSGNIPKRVLIRGIGPGLAQFGVTSTLANPRLELYRGSTRLRENDDWVGAADLSTAFTQVGAFLFTSTASRDAAMLVELAPGSYTAQVSGVNNAIGVGMIEVYELP